MKLPALLQFRVLKLAVQSLFSKPFTTRFPKEEFTPIPQFRGRPRYSADECMGCGACAQVCPSQCIDVIDDLTAELPRRRLIQHLDACICCGQCEHYCPTEKGIRLTNEYDFVGFRSKDFEEHVEKELVLCESCGAMIAPLDQIRWIARRLGPLAFDNPTLMLAALRELHVVDSALTPLPDSPFSRGQHLTIQCPRCRRQTALAV